MKRKGKIIYVYFHVVFTCFLLTIPFVTLSQAYSESLNSSQGLIAVEKDVFELKDFSHFEILNNWSHITSVRSTSEIRFNISAEEERPLSWNDIAESYCLDISKFGNCSSLVLELEFTYRYLGSNPFGYFSLELGGELSSFVGTIVNIGVFNHNYLIHSQLHASHLDKEFTLGSTSHPLNGSLKVQILKNGGKLVCKLLNAEGELFRKKWYSAKNFTPVTSININFNAFCNFSVTASSFSGELTLENRNWQTLKVGYNVLVGLLIFFAVLIPGFFVVMILLKNREKKELKLQKLNDEFLSYESQTATTRERELHYLIYDGEENNNQICGICKLAIAKGEPKFYCPSCHTLFHRRHLIDWLKQNKKCPICKEQLRY
ncbi:MAG: hypothetical protein GF308_02510 [Candidatus Heimdallarchaeota archaeon]|nr:hypothetical protein [Candidatus Heimdallarchaeota archaeon]